MSEDSNPVHTVNRVKHELSGAKIDYIDNINPLALFPLRV